MYMWRGMFLYRGSSIRTRVHGHHALQIAISESRPFRMKLGREWEEFSAVVISPDSPHECELEDKQVIFIGIEPESGIARAIRNNYLNGALYRRLDADMAGNFTGKIAGAVQANESPAKVNESVYAFLDVLTGGIPLPVTPDQRVDEVIKKIHRSLPSKVSIAGLAEEVFLSQSRLIHIFTEYTGIPLRKYILWNRLVHGVYAVINGATITEAAYDAGFADSAHFSRIFTRMLGTPPTGIFNNSRNIQAYICE